MSYYFIRKIILHILSIIIVTNYACANDINIVQKKHGSDINNKKLTLSKAVEDAIKLSPQIKSTQSAISALLGSVQQAGYKPNPEVGFNVDNIAGRGVYQGISATEYDLNISQQIEMGDKRNARIHVATTSIDTVKVNILTHKLDIKYAVEMLYLDILVAKEQMKLALSQEDMTQKTLNFITKRVNMAAEHETQRSKAHFLYKKAVSNRKIAQQQFIQAKQKLSIICGYHHTNFDVYDNYFSRILPPSVFLNYTENIINTPDLQKFNLIKKEKQALVELQKANAVPDPRITVGIRHFTDSSDQALMVGASIPIAIYNKNQGNIARAYAEIEQVEYDRKQAEFTTQQILINTQQELSNAYIQLDDIEKKLLPEARHSFSLAKIAYRNEILSYIEVLDAQTTLFETKQQYIQILKQYHVAKIKINRLTDTI